MYCRKNGELEEFLTDDEALFDEATEWACDNGYDHFRIAEIDLTTKPDFVGTINKDKEVSN